jgi:chromate transporter
LPLWLIPLVTLSLTGADFLATIGWFFAKLAVVTFGGAYAVLAYMSQAVVQTHGWISTGQMIDALGLAETTPGPLILVTQFVAMLAGQLQQGPLLAMAAGLVALWATFVPCFLWIFAAAPHLERITGHARLGAALKAISAAVTGIILNLSVWFAMHVLFSETGVITARPLAIPHPQLNSLDLPALALTVASAVLILGLKQRLELTLILMSAAGLALHFL